MHAFADTSQKKKPIVAAVFPQAPSVATKPPVTPPATTLDSPQEKVQTKPCQQFPRKPQQPLTVPGNRHAVKCFVLLNSLQVLT